MVLAVGVLGRLQNRVHMVGHDTDQMQAYLLSIPVPTGVQYHLSAPVGQFNVACGKPDEVDRATYLPVRQMPARLEQTTFTDRWQAYPPSFDSAAGLYADLGLSAELLLSALPLVGIHSAVNRAGRVAPTVKMIPNVFQRVPMLGEDDQLSSAILQLCELGALQA